MLNAIADGAISGVSAGAQRLLRAGKDLDAQIQKVLSLQSVFDRLKSIEDPVGFALQTLDREFAKLRSIAIEAGEGLVEVEKLYGIQRAEALKEANDRIAGSLRDLLNELTIGNDARPLTERLNLAQSKFDPLAARVAAGDRTAYDDFAEAARELLDIQRQFSGSQTGYFDLLNRVTDLTRNALGSTDAISFAAANSDSPFASNGSAANDNVVSAIDGQTNLLLAAANQTNEYMRLLVSQRGGISAIAAGVIGGRAGTLDNTYF